MKVAPGRLRRLGLGLIAATALSGPGREAASQAPGTQGTAEPGYACGTMSLTTLLRLEGRSIPPADVDAVLPARPEHSMAELIDAGRRIGLSLHGVRLNRGDWPLDRPALVHVNRNGSGHYIVIRPMGSTGRLVQVIDPIDGSEVEDADRLFSSRQWTGAALLPARLKDHPASRLAPFAGLFVLCLSGFFLIRRVFRRRA